MNAFNVFIRSPYNYDMDQASHDSGLLCLDDSLTKQEFKEECDINTIVRNFGLTGAMPDEIISPLQGDFTEITDYRSALHLIMEADAAFMEMPAESRERFSNDPQRWLDFVSNPDNAQAMVDMGLAAIRRPPEPLTVRMEPPPTPIPNPTTTGVPTPPSVS